MLKIKKLPQNRWQDYRNLRLEALQSDPLAFLYHDYEEKDRSEKEWKRRMKNMLFAMVADQPVGMLAYVKEEKAKVRHVVNLYSFFVKKEYRGQGIGRSLVRRAIDNIQKNPRFLKIKLSVISEQKAAISLYKIMGFEIVGRYKKEMFVGDKYYDEIIMEKHF
jgi:ribosomal protein S18 acetylase RimI-like enzyme